MQPEELINKIKRFLELHMKPELDMDETQEYFNLILDLGFEEIPETGKPLPHHMALRLAEMLMDLEKKVS